MTTVLFLCILSDMKRTIQKKLIQWMQDKNRKPLILKGARQVGKTYTLLSFARENFVSVHYLNFEKDEKLTSVFLKDLNPTRILNELNFYLNTSINIKKDILIFDEIQNAPRALTSLKYFNEEIPELPICAAGSLLGLHLSHESFPVGKVEFLDMYPLSFEEFLEGIDDTKALEFLNSRLLKEKSLPDIVHAHLWEQLKIYFVVGGLPEVVKIYNELKDDLFTALSMVRKKQNDLILAYNADMAKHSGKQNAMHIERIWRNIPSQLAKDQNGSVPKYSFKDVIPGINRYSRLAGPIDWLSTTGLIIKTYIVNKGELPFSAYSKENNFKITLFDTGILGALCDLPPKSILDYEYGTYKGYFAENFVAQEFLYSGVKQLYSWKENTSEVEFLREVDGKIIPVEIKSGWVTQAKSIKVFSEKYHPPYRTIMSAHTLHIDPHHKVHCYPLYLASRFPIE